MKFVSIGILGALALAMQGGCGGSSGGGGGGGGPVTSGARLLSTFYGRLVDIYAYRRIDPAVSDRRVTTNREPVLVQRDVVVSPAIESEDLIDAVGEIRPGSSFRFLPFDVAVGHEELLILFDDTTETAQFDEAFDRARAGLIEISPAFRDQNVVTNPIPVVPRNAAIELRFDRDLGLTPDFFANNPSAIQVLRFRDDPNVVPAPVAFEPATVRIVTDGGSTIVVDTTLVGGETSLNRATNGLQPSADSVTANYRIALPTSGLNATVFRVRPDSVADLNGVDSIGDPAAIRDFRAGNLNDGRVGALDDFEAPQIVTQKRMGITDIDETNRIVTVNKRGAQVAIRARIPFVDGVLSRDTGLPRGPSEVPTVNENRSSTPLRAGDFLVQNVISPITGESVRIRSEILQVLEVGAVEGDGNFAGPGLTAMGTDGGELATVRLRLATISSRDSAGNVVSLEEDSTSGNGADCDVTVRYYEFLNYAARMGAGIVSDAGRRAEFALVDPVPGQPSTGQGVLPDATFGFQFSEPMDVAAIDPFDNFVLSNNECNVGNFQQVLAEPKSASLNFLVSRLIDRRGDGTQLDLQAPMGLFHQNGQTENYWVHLDIATGGIRDLAGNRLDLFDRREPDTINVGGISVEVPIQNFSMRFSLEPTALDNWVGGRVFRFAAADEDGTLPGSVDFFGQFQLDNGMLRASPVTRRSRTADVNNLQTIERWNRGECVNPEVPADPMGMPPTPRIPPISFRPATNPTYGNGALYSTPDMSSVQPGPPLVFQPPAGPQPFGGVVEPHTSFGARMQMAYREDDFGLSYHDASDLNIDVEQMSWAEWADAVVLFDRFDRYTMKLGHAGKRPDYLFRRVVDMMGNVTCGLDCTSLFSSLSPSFANNPLEGTELVEVLKDKQYIINPNDAFRAASGVKYIPYPEFDNTYTWRDSRHASWNMGLSRAVGFGGAVNPVDPPPIGDSTAHISSPWCQDDLATAMIGITGDRSGWEREVIVRDYGDFNGCRTLDHDPIALPLLVDFSVWPDDTRAVANAGNLIHMAFFGPIWTPANPNGYYNAGGGVITTFPPDVWACNNIDWPHNRVFSIGGPDPNNPGTFNRIDPDRELVARGGVIKDLGLGDPIAGLSQVKGTDSSVYWSQIDLVRKVSLVTFGFFDSLQPNRHALAAANPPIPALPPAVGRPDLSVINGGDVRVQDLVAVLDPPPIAQPGGTSVAIEFRGADTITNAGVYDRLAQDRPDLRQNLLNPNYACEAYRYAMDHPGEALENPPAPNPAFRAGSRVPAEGLTPYVNEDNLDTIRNPVNNLLPRFLNFRLIMENNINSNPAQAPALRSVGVAFRVARSS
jgi:hypothetical protein